MTNCVTNYFFVVTMGIRLYMETFITANEEIENLPSYTLVLLDIRNTFNAVSCQNIRAVIKKEFPERNAFADLQFEAESVLVLR